MVNKSKRQYSTTLKTNTIILLLISYIRVINNINYILVTIILF